MSNQTNSNVTNYGLADHYFKNELSKNDFQKRSGFFFFFMINTGLDCFIYLKRCYHIKMLKKLFDHDKKTLKHKENSFIHIIITL